MFALLTFNQRTFATEKKADEFLFPGSESKNKNDEVLDKPPPLPSVTKLTPSTAIPSSDIPKPPPDVEELLDTSASSSKSKANAPAPYPSVPKSTDSGVNTEFSSVNASVPPPPSAPPSSPSASRTPKSPQAPITRKRPRPVRRFLLSLIILSGFGYAGGVYYSLVSDNFHDFFTEYIPYGDEAVGYFEEREYTKRFPPRTPPPRLHAASTDDRRVTIPSKSGVSVRQVQQDSGDTKDPSSVRGRHMSALDDSDHGKSNPATENKRSAQAAKPEIAQPTKAATETSQKKSNNPSDTTKEKSAEAANKKKNDVLEKEAPKKEQVVPEAAAKDAQKQNTSKETKAPKPRPSASVKALPLIDNINIEGAEEPAVQDVVKMLNDIITVVNADNAAGKYSSTIETAKERLGKAIKDIGTLKAKEKQAAEQEMKALHMQFDAGVKELVSRLEREMHDQESRWKEEYESEREKLVSTYEERLKAEAAAAQQLYNQKLQNALTEEKIGQTRHFARIVRDAVEHERGGRLSKLSELESSVHNLEQLTAKSSEIVDTALQTQHMLVAVDALAAKLDNADRPVPFTSELAAVRDTAGDDAVIAAATATVPMASYQRGLPTAAELRDRFRAVAGQVRKAALLPENAGVASHAASWALSNLLARKQGTPEGSDVESVLARAESWLARGDLESAAREVNGLTGWSKTLASDWLEEVRRVCEVRQALDVSVFAFFLKKSKLQISYTLMLISWLWVIILICFSRSLGRRLDFGVYL